MEMDVDPIKAQYFYKNDRKKIKVNRFCYEYAYMFYSKIRENPKMKRFKAKYTQDEITGLCVHFSLAMKKSMCNKSDGVAPALVLAENYIYEYNPRISRWHRSLLIDMADKAWDGYLSICECCPTRCISEWYVKCDMFDRLTP
ncbi:MAG: hypothetical protein LBS62_01140 [Clostridiales bacterium]|jgi:hypothetical protein|nr:hypothetical protein [Clostridiales bacterium]